MKKTLHLYLVIVSLATLTTARAQLFKIDLSEKTRSSTLIAEGRVIAQKCFWDDAHNMIYTANTIQVYKTFKGTTASSTIEVVTQGGSVGTKAIAVSELLTLHKGQTGIFFCQENTINLKSPATHHVLYDVYSSDQGFLRYNLAYNRASAPFAAYNDIENNLYSLIEKETGESRKIIDAGFSPAAEFKNHTVAAGNGVAGTLTASIAAFSPATVNAGALNNPANNILTITGSGFDDAPGGSSAINFTDGNSDNNPPDYEVPYNSPYIISWTDKQIVVKVPGNAATGPIAVVLKNGATVQSATNLTVFFAVLDFDFDFSTVGVDTIIAAEPRLMNTNNRGGYTYKFSANTAGKGKNFAADSAAVAFTRAVTTWQELAGANLISGGNTNVQVITDDGVNTIEYDNTNTNLMPMAAGVLEVTYSYGSTCYIASPFRMLSAQKTGFDILIRNPDVSKGAVIKFEKGPCFPVPGSYDLENIILHELGHALNLTHINDSYEITQGLIQNINPGKVMHYAIIDYADRRSPDASAYQGTLYTITPLALQFGTCGFPGEMVPLDFSPIANDECPGTFPTSPTPPGTIVNFDLVHATSNKFKDPAFTQVNCQNKGTFVTNNAWYALKTTSLQNGTLSLKISGYTTTPAEIAGCSGQGVRMALYKVSACPVGQAFPQPVACATFTGNGTLSNITGLAPDATYLLYFDGLRNTKANFNVTLNGSALPIVLSSFTGEYTHGADNLYVEIQQAINVKNIVIEKSADGSSFSQLGILQASPANLVGKHTYIDVQPFAGNNYYRLKVVDNDGNYQYSNIVLLKNTVSQLIYVYPNPAKNNVFVSLSGTPAGRYNFIMYNVEGKAVFNTAYTLGEGNQTISLPLENKASGMYMIKITNAAGKTVSQQKVVKQQGF